MSEKKLPPTKPPLKADLALIISTFCSSDYLDNDITKVITTNT